MKVDLKGTYPIVEKPEARLVFGYIERLDLTTADPETMLKNLKPGDDFCISVGYKGTDTGRVLRSTSKRAKEMNMELNMTFEKDGDTYRVSRNSPSRQVRETWRITA